MRSFLCIVILFLFTDAVLFSPYKDITNELNWEKFNFSTVAVTKTLQPLVTVLPSGIDTVTWGFVTGDCSSECIGSFCGEDQLKVLRTANIQQWNNFNKKYILAVGGASGGFKCISDGAFDSFLNRYYSSSLIGVDIDIEGSYWTQTDIDNIVARIKYIQQSAASKFKNLRFSFTIPTTGLSSYWDPNNIDPSNIGKKVIQSIKNKGLTNYFINLMTMDFGTDCILLKGSLNSCHMGQSTIEAVKGLNKYQNIPFQKIEITPLIGEQDFGSSIFTIDDVKMVTKFAVNYSLPMVHFWSFDRDIDCQFLPVKDIPVSNSTCMKHGVKGQSLAYTKAFLVGLEKKVSEPTAKPTSSSPTLKPTSSMPTISMRPTTAPSTSKPSTSYPTVVSSTPSRTNKPSTLAPSSSVRPTAAPTTSAPSVRLSTFNPTSSAPTTTSTKSQPTTFVPTVISSSIFPFNKQSTSIPTSFRPTIIPSRSKPPTLTSNPSTVSPSYLRATNFPILKPTNPTIYPK